MVYSQSKIEDLLKLLREHQTESPTIDGKVDLFLDKEGDRAFFIRHVAALANNVEPSSLIIGVKDKTWELIGLSEDSSLRDADSTQNRMNQILAIRLDPHLPVTYRTYELSGVTIGLVVVEGKRAPYIVAIEDQKYGGLRTQGGPSYIYRGAIYVRHGANSIIANRQSEILHLIDKVQREVISESKPDEFLTTNNYLDPESPDFGHHRLTERLIEIYSFPSIKQIPAQTWVSFVICPVDNGCEIDTVALKAKLKPDQRIGRGEKWYQDIPRDLLEILWKPQVTPREFLSLGTWLAPQRGQQNIQEITHFIHIKPSGHIEFVCTAHLVRRQGDIKFFAFVSLIGYLWQLIYFSKAIYQDAGFYGKVVVLLNLIGTKESFLAEFANSNQGGWGSSLIGNYPNIQIEQSFTLADVSDEEIEAKVRKVAKNLGAYYGQDHPQCFDYHTGDFPYTDYLRQDS